jgi:type II secretory pathway pseudopilin PulG
MARLTTRGDLARRAAAPGYVLIMLTFAVFLLAIGLLVALPVLQTEVQREKEEELIFRGRQYAEAVRIYARKNPGRFPASLKELLDKKCIRRLYRDPFSRDGRWNVILVSVAGRGSAPSATGRAAAQEVLVAPERVLSAIKNPMVLGVVSTSTARSVKIWNDQESHDKWLFYFGQDPKKPPKIVYYGEEKR